MSRILRPEPVHHLDEARPAIFLAGPIQGAGDWQADAMGHLQDLDVDIFSPRSLGAVPDYWEQVAWERVHLNRAGRHGVVMFWLCNPKKLAWRQRLNVLFTGIPSRPHAQTSRLELGWELARSVMADPKHGVHGKVVIGMEKGFSNERFITRLVEVEARLGPVHASLEATCAAAREALLAMLPKSVAA